MNRGAVGARLGGLAAALVIVGTFVGGAAGSTPPLAGSQGTDTSLPATDSQAVVRGRGVFSSLELTINQTADLTNQAISITWTGATPTQVGPGRFGAHYLQIMQCWGDADSSVPANPGPPPEQCVWGAAAGTYGGVPNAPLPNGFATSRIISRTGWSNFVAANGVFESKTTNLWKPFRAVNGTVIGSHADPDFNPSVVGGNFWLNPFFNIVTTNEIPAAATGTDGKGAALFEAQTGLESSGLGCGQRVQPVAGAQPKIPTCWLVVVPRGAPAVENAGTPFAESAAQDGVMTSPLTPEVWQNRIAVPLGFRPIDSPCALGADERRLSGSELVLPAISSWQPALCSAQSLPPFSFAPVNDGTARQQITSSQPGGPGLVVVGEPLAPEVSTAESPVVYAPMSVSGVVIGFNIERNPKTDAPDDAQTLTGVRVAELNLTPRLVAKLLSQSYKSQLRIAGNLPTATWLSANPEHLAFDPDFLRFNPEFAQLQIQDGRTFGGLQLPVGSSDAARQVWDWILADPEARAWMGGAADEWGMRVNPNYSTEASDNPSGGAFGTPLPTSYPKADPYCYQAPNIGTDPVVTPPRLCGTDWMPYSRNYLDSARITRVAFDAARISQNLFARSSGDVWKTDLPQYIGRRAMLSLTDTPSAAQYGIQTARLSRAGDNGATRAFIPPTAAGLAAGVAAMKPGTSPGVRVPDPTVDAPGAYPLTTLTTAVIRPLSLDSAARNDFAAFLEYVGGPGQVVGSEIGQLPRGYLPLPAELKALTVEAASTVRSITAPAPTTTTSPDTTTTSPDTTTTSPDTATTAPSTSTPTTIVASQPVVIFPTPSGSTSSRPVTATTAAPAPIDSSTTTTTVEATTTTEPQPSTTTTVPPPDAVAPTTTAAPTTAAVKTSPARFVMAGMGAVSLLSALVALEITKRTRRSSSLLIESAGEVPHG